MCRLQIDWVRDKNGAPHVQNGKFILERRGVYFSVRDYEIQRFRELLDELELYNESVDEEYEPRRREAVEVMSFEKAEPKLRVPPPDELPPASYREDETSIRSASQSLADALVGIVRAATSLKSQS